MNLNDYIPEVEIAELQKEAVGLCYAVSNRLDIPEIIVNMREPDGRIYNEIVFHFKTFIFGESAGEETHTFSRPADWWQAFKQRWYPDWLLEKHPVKFYRETVTFSAKALYPHFKPSLPDQRHVIRIAKHGPVSYNAGMYED